MTRAEFYDEIAEILECDSSEVTGAALLNDLPNWDSLAVLSFLVMVDTRLGATVQGNQLKKCITVDDLVRLLPGKIED